MFVRGGDQHTDACSHTDAYSHTDACSHTDTHILTGRLVVVHINSVKLQDRVSHIVAGCIDAVLVADDFPELDVPKVFSVSLGDIISDSFPNRAVR